MTEKDAFETGDQLALTELAEAVADEEAEQAVPVLPVLHDVLDEIAEEVTNHCCVGVILLDVSNLGPWERRHGATSFQTLMGHLSGAIKEMQGGVIRRSDRICLEAVGGDTVLIFLSQPRKEDSQPASMVDLEDVVGRIKRGLFEPLAMSQMIYQKALDLVSMGSALILHNSSVDPRREIYRAIRRARADAMVSYHEMQRRRNRVVGHMIAHRKIHTVYQPIMRLKSREVLGFEALSRADRTDAERLGVHLFVAASRAELDGELDQACRALSVVRRPAMTDETKLFINCLPPTFFSPNRELDRLVDGWLEDGLKPTQLVFEVTEQITYEQVVRIMPTIQRLRDRGFLFALDDVGTGAANLRLLADLEPDFIKMDIGLTNGISGSHRKRELAEYLMELARKSGATLIAEGIETDEDLQVLVEIGVPLGQGYLLGRPQEAGKLLAG